MKKWTQIICNLGANYSCNWKFMSRPIISISQIATCGKQGKYIFEKHKQTNRAAIQVEKGWRPLNDGICLSVFFFLKKMISLLCDTLQFEKCAWSDGSWTSNCSCSLRLNCRQSASGGNVHQGLLYLSLGWQFSGGRYEISHQIKPRQYKLLNANNGWGWIF